MVKFEQNTVYQAETEEQAEWILNEGDRQGYKWNSGRSLKTNNRWSDYKSKTCYDITEGAYCDVEYYRAQYKIIKVKNLMTDKIIDLW